MKLLLVCYRTNKRW